MKANVSKSAIIALFLFVTSSIFANPGTDATLYHNVKTLDNTVSTTYFKKNSEKENMLPFRKKVKTVDENGICVSNVTYDFCMEAKAWKLSNKMVYNYNDGKLTSIEYSEWNEKRNTWNEPKVVSYTYTEDNKVKVDHL